MAKKKQSTEDCISRVRCMAVDTAGLWLLSDKDREALQHVLSERESMAAELASLQSEIERLRRAARDAGWHKSNYEPEAIND